MTSGHCLWLDRDMTTDHELNRRNAERHGASDKILRRTTDRLFAGWDDVRPTSECPHCHGTGLAPGDGQTECGFCETSPTLTGLRKERFDVI